jgi:acyl dehydratase
MTPRAVVSDWLVVSQDRIDRFADAIGDHQWIHVDPARAGRESPYGATVAHGFLTLSLISTLLAGSSPVTARMAVNYGLNKVRFLAPVIAGSKIRARFEPKAVEERVDAQKVIWRVTVETDNRGPRPEAPGLVCVAEWIVLYYA